MDRTEQKKTEETPVVSPLANEKTYGERMYSRIFDWGLNYWTNLLASAGFSQWVEHSVKPFKIPFLMKEAASPRDLQQSLADGVRKHDPFFRMFERNKLKEMVGKSAHEIETVIHDRSMARARSLTLLMPGFVVMIPAVWLGAKFKPWLVEHWNKNHYGEDAMDDPSIKARHQAIEAAARPTLLGTVIARFATVGMVQIAAQTVGSNENLVQKMGAKKFTGIDPFTEKLGTALGGAIPQNMQNSFNKASQRWGYDWSLAQHKAGIAASGPYSNASQDLGRFVVADTVYTLITAMTINPIVKFLPKLPIIGRFMSIKPKVAANSPVFDSDGKLIKVPANRYADAAEDAPARTAEPAANDATATEPAREQPAANDEQFGDDKKPATKVSHAKTHATLATGTHHHYAGAGA